MAIRGMLVRYEVLDSMMVLFDEIEEKLWNKVLLDMLTFCQLKKVRHERHIACGSYSKLILYQSA